MKVSQTKEGKKFKKLLLEFKQGQAKHMYFTHGRDNNTNSAKEKGREDKDESFT